LHHDDYHGEVGALHGTFQKREASLEARRSAASTIVVIAKPTPGTVHLVSVILNAPKLLWLESFDHHRGLETGVTHFS
jgi:hypothetical protein